MSDVQHDLAVIGGGLAGGLIALAAHRARPDLSLALVEAGESFGGNHRWSWFEGDLAPEEEALLGAFSQTRWTGGNTVRFPDYERRMAAEYRSLSSRDFDAGLRRALPQSALRPGCRAVSVDAGGVTLAGGQRISARAVIDCRDAVPSPHLEGGWQVFLGQVIRTLAPHGIEHPVIMDAAVGQPGAYRFVYVLPLSPDEIFIEDTYYANGPLLDAPLLRRRIADYAAERGWQGEVIEEETGVLPVITGGDFAAYRASLAIPGVALAGARGGFVHPLTSYTMPVAARTALAIGARAGGDGATLAAFADEAAQAHWRDTGFYRLLGRMLFGAAQPEKRWRIFARFYRLPEPLIERFYAARSTPLDKARVLTGRPPVPIPAALRAILGKGAPLVHEGGA